MANWFKLIWSIFAQVVTWASNTNEVEFQNKNVLLFERFAYILSQIGANKIKTNWLRQI